MDNVNVNQNIHITFILEKFHISLNLYKSYINESLKLWNDQQIRSFDNFQVTLSVKQTSMHACSPVIIYQLLIHKSEAPGWRSNSYKKQKTISLRIQPFTPLADNSTASLALSWKRPVRIRGVLRARVLAPDVEHEDSGNEDKRTNKHWQGTTV